MSVPAEEAYDLCVVGAGCVGSAIARHASAIPSLKVCLIGPQEPKTRVDVTGREIYGAHYDNGRITRTTDPDPVWAHISKQSQIRYRELETLSGINFYADVGALFVGDENILERYQKLAADQVDRREHSELLRRYPYLKFGDQDVGLYNHTGGIINPRAQVDASIVVASKQGCDIIRDIVCQVTKSDKSSGSVMVLKTESGKTFYSKKVVLATNSFTTSRDLLQGVKIKFDACPQTVVFAEVDASDLERLRTMPSIMYYGPGSLSWFDYPRNPDGFIKFYMLPPILYPDGKYYIKIGHSDLILKEFLRHEDISRWHSTGGDPWLIDCLTELLKSMFIGVQFKSFHSDSCVTMVTPTSRPYIEKINDCLGVAIGGNGHSAKCGDEIGHIAAEMMTSSSWTYKLPQIAFKMVVESENEKTELKSKI